MKATTKFVALALLASACGGDGSTGPGEPPASFAVLEASVEAVGVHQDADGYDIVVDGSKTQRVLAGGKARFVDLAPGDHVVEVKDVAENCSVAGANPRSVSMKAGTTGTALFDVSCSQVPLGIVFASDRLGSNTLDILSLKADGTGPLVKVTPGQAVLLAVSPDGSRVAFTSTRDGNPDIFIVNADGSGLRNLTQNPATDVYPAFSPDGSKIAFMSGRDGGLGDIFVMNVDGTGVVNLTRNPAAEHEPHWCSNGRIVFTRTAAPRQADIYSMNADGSDVRRITNDNVIVNTPRWSPDCSKVAFASIRHAGPNGHASDDLDLYVINADGSGLQRLTSTAGYDVGPSWSPDGTRIAFATRRDGNGEIYVMNADGTGAFNLTGNPAIDDAPHWVR